MAELNYTLKYNTKRAIKPEQDEKDVTILENFDVETNELMRRIEQLRIEESKINFQPFEVKTEMDWTRMITIILPFAMIGIAIMICTKLMRTTQQCLD